MTRLIHIRRLFYDLLLALYAAWFIITREIYKADSTLINWLAVPITAVDRLISRWRGGLLIFPRGDAELNLDLGAICLLAGILVSGLWMAERLPRVRNVLDYMTIAVLVIGPLLTPVLLGDHVNENGYPEFTDAGHLHVSRQLEFGEMALVLTLTCLSRVRWRPWIVMLLLAAHSCFWISIIAGDAFFQRIRESIPYLVFPFAASIVWPFLRGREAAVPLPPVRERTQS
jgi:hypothetical protein